MISSTIRLGSCGRAPDTRVAPGTRVAPSSRVAPNIIVAPDTRLSPNPRVAPIGSGWIEMDQSERVGSDRVGSGWIGFGRVGSGWIGSVVSARPFAIHIMCCLVAVCLHNIR